MSFCPDCGGERIHRRSHLRSMQRYRYSVYGRAFSTLTGTQLARLRHPAELQDDLNNMLDGQLGQKAADRLGVHRNVSFRWRLRLLRLAKGNPPAARRGIAEADELFLLESENDSCELYQPSRQRGVYRVGAASANTSVCW